MRGNEAGLRYVWICGRTTWGRATRWIFALGFAAALLVAGLSGARAMAQTGGDGAIQGTVRDATGAIISNALVTAKNVATAVVTTRTTSSDGLYNIGPLIPGRYEVTVAAN